MQHASDAISILNNAIEQFLETQNAVIKQFDSHFEIERPEAASYPAAASALWKHDEVREAATCQGYIGLGKPSRRTLYANTPLPDLPCRTSTQNEVLRNVPKRESYAVELRRDRSPGSVPPLSVRKRTKKAQEIPIAENISAYLDSNKQYNPGNYYSRRRSSLAMRLANDREICSPLSMLGALAMKPLLQHSDKDALEAHSTAICDYETISDFLDWPNQASYVFSEHSHDGNHKPSDSKYKQVLPREPDDLIPRYFAPHSVYTWQETSSQTGVGPDPHQTIAKKTYFEGLSKKKFRMIDRAKTVLCL